MKTKNRIRTVTVWKHQTTRTNLHVDKDSLKFPRVAQYIISLLHTSSLSETIFHVSEGKCCQNPPE